MIIEHIATQFNAISEKYDAQRKLLIPCFEDFYSIPLELSGQLPQVKSILDVGSGTGLMSAFFHEKYPAAQLTLVDISEKMMQKAKDRFNGEDNIEYLLADFAEVDFGENKYCAVISGLAIHHLTHELKKLLFEKIYKVLKPGGLFINADQVEGENEDADKIYKTTWAKKVRTAPLPEEEKKACFERVKLDIFAKLSDQLQWLREIGFENAANYYQHYNFVVFAGQKPKK